MDATPEPRRSPQARRCRLPAARGVSAANDRGPPAVLALWTNGDILASRGPGTSASRAYPTVDRHHIANADSPQPPRSRAEGAWQECSTAWGLTCGTPSGMVPGIGSSIRENLDDGRQDTREPLPPNGAPAGLPVDAVARARPSRPHLRRLSAGRRGDRRCRLRLRERRSRLRRFFGRGRGLPHPGQAADKLGFEACCADAGLPHRAIRRHPRRRATPSATPHVLHPPAPASCQARPDQPGCPTDSARWTKR